MTIYLLWFDEWEANHLLGIFDLRRDAERWRDYFLATAIDISDDDYEEADYILHTMAHFAKNGDLVRRIHIAETVPGNLMLKVNNLKLLEWETKQREEKNP